MTHNLNIITPAPLGLVTPSYIIEYIQNDDINSIKKYYCKYQTRINVKDIYGNYVIQYAIIYKKFKIINLFLEFNANINLQDMYGNTSIHYIYQILLDSINERDYIYILEIIHLIIQKYKGNIFIKNNDDISPYDMAFNNKYINETLIKCILHNKFQYIEFLVNLGCNINYQDKNGNTALHYLCMIDLFISYKYIKLLLLNGIDTKILNNVKLKAEKYLIL